MNKETENLNLQWDILTRLLHWVSAVWVLYLMGLGLIMVNLVHTSGLKFELYQFHKSYGLLFGLILIIRVAWKFRAQQKNMSNSTDPHKIARINQNLLLFLLAALIVSGYVVTCFSVIPIPIRVFGWTVPFLLRPDMSMEQGALAAHHTFAFVGLALVLLHSCAALFHHFILKDKTLIRMLVKMDG